MSPRKRYCYGSITVDSSLPLPVLPIAATDDEVVLIDRCPEACPGEVQWCHHWRDRDDVVLSLARQGTDYWLRFPHQADFLLQIEAGRILVVADTPADQDTLEHLLVDQVLPRFLAHRAQLVVHASAATIGRHHALFLGPSGWGKSTLAGLLQRHGHTVTSDDCVQLRRAHGRYQALATYPSLRLYSDSLGALFPGEPETSPVASYTEKMRVSLHLPDGFGQAVTVDALYLLGDPAEAGDDPRIAPMSPSQTCQALIAHSFRLDMGNREGNAAHFARCAAVVNAVPAFRLDYRRDFEQSGALVDAIARHVSGLPPTSSNACTA